MTPVQGVLLIVGVGFSQGFTYGKTAVLLKNYSKDGRLMQLLADLGRCDLGGFQKVGFLS